MKLTKQMKRDRRWAAITGNHWKRIKNTDTMRLDFMGANPGKVSHARGLLGASDSWAYDSGHGVIKTKRTLRAAIDAAILARRESHDDRGQAIAAWNSRSPDTEREELIWEVFGALEPCYKHHKRIEKRNKGEDGLPQGRCVCSSCRAYRVLARLRAHEAAAAGRRQEP